MYARKVQTVPLRPRANPLSRHDGECVACVRFGHVYSNAYTSYR